MILDMEETKYQSIVLREAIKKLARRTKKGKKGKEVDSLDDGRLQNTHTPFDLCLKILSKLSEQTNISESDILVLFNLEFVYVLINEFRVDPARITFGSSSFLKNRFAKEHIGCEILEVTYSKDKKRVEIMPEPNRKFDVVVMNPPYQAPKKLKKGKKNGTSGGDLWSKFVLVSHDIVIENGVIAAVHPPMWRKPEHDLFSLMQKKNLLFLEMHSEEDGRKTFKASTKYDWYVLKNGEYCGETEIIDEEGDRQIFDLRDYRWLPCFGFDVVSKILAQGKEKTCEVLYSRSEYGTDKPNMSDTETDEYKYPCVYSMTKDGFGCWYSSVKKDFAFGVPKVILGWGRYLYPFIDMEGKYGLTQNTFAIKVDCKKEAENIKKAIESDKFSDVLKSTKWGAFQTEWRMFKYFKKDFWKEFI